MPIRKLKPIEERDPYAAAVLDAFDKLPAQFEPPESRMMESTECVSHHTACECRERLFARALKIADQAMAELLFAHARRADEHGVFWALCNADGGDVNALREADTPAIEAVQWLQERGLCELTESSYGATVVILRELL